MIAATPCSKDNRLTELTEVPYTTPEQPMKLNIEIFPINAVMKKGHRLRVSIGPSDFPHAISPLTQHLNQLGGVITILHDPEHPSFIVLPVVESFFVIKNKPVIASKFAVTGCHIFYYDERSTQ